MKWRHRRRRRRTHKHRRIFRRGRSSLGLKELLQCPNLTCAAGAASAIVKDEKKMNDELVEILLGSTWSRAVSRFDEDPASCRKIFEVVRAVAPRARSVASDAVEAALEASSFAPEASAAVLNARFERHDDQDEDTLRCLGWPVNAPAQWKIRDVDRAWLNSLVDEPTAKPALRACAAIGPPAVPEFLEARGLCLRDLLDDQLESIHVSCFQEDDDDDDDDGREFDVLEEDDDDEEEVYVGLSWDSMPHYLKYPYEDGTGAEGDCCICLESLVDPAVRHRRGKPVRLDCACSKFLFHELCLRQHLATKVACPVCRAVPLQNKPSRAPLVW